MATHVLPTTLEWLEIQPSSRLSSKTWKKEFSGKRKDDEWSRSSFEFSAQTAPAMCRNNGAFVHGTKFANFNSIMQWGLKASLSEIYIVEDNEMSRHGHVPGLAAPPEILVFIDEKKAREYSMDFDYDVAKGTFKTRGIDGVIRPWFFQKVLDQRPGTRGNVLFQSKEDPVMKVNWIPKSRVPDFLIHATYWENVQGIAKEGIVPAKNPTSSLRQPLRSMLQGAENHVYTTACRRERSVEEVFRKRKHRMASPSPDNQRDFKVNPDDVGLEKVPDAWFWIDTAKANQLGVKLDLVQSSDRDDTVFIQGHVPPEVLVRAEANEPIDLPACLKAEIVDGNCFTDIPVIDISQDEAQVVEQMRYACEVVGFMQVTGHGVSPELEAKRDKVHKKFFELSSEVKDRLKLDDDHPVRGYFGKGGENLEQVILEKVDAAAGSKLEHKRQDNKEAFDMNAVPWSKPVGGNVARIFGQPSRLPTEEESPGFREVMEEYSNAMFDLAKRILQIMALILDLPRNFFDMHLTNPVATQRLLHYWPMKDYLNEIGVGEHTDYGLLTILKQDNVGGLQVYNAKEEKWVHAYPIENAFVVNLGDMMGRWTAHRFKSTLHRVVNVNPSERFSAPFFLEPNLDTMIVYGGLCGFSQATDRWAHADHEESATSEQILERFYIASGQLKARCFSSLVATA